MKPRSRRSMMVRSIGLLGVGALGTWCSGPDAWVQAAVPHDWQEVASLRISADAPDPSMRVPTASDVPTDGGIWAGGAPVQTDAQPAAINGMSLSLSLSHLPHQAGASVAQATPAPAQVDTSGTRVAMLDNDPSLTAATTRSDAPQPTAGWVAPGSTGLSTSLSLAGSASTSASAGAGAGAGAIAQPSPAPTTVTVTPTQLAAWSQNAAGGGAVAASLNAAPALPHSVAAQWRVDEDAPTVAARAPVELASRAAEGQMARASSPSAPVPAPAPTEPRFDFVVNNAPASEVFLQLGVGTNYNILVSPEILGTISLSLRQTTVVEVLESLRELYGYDFRVVGNRVFVYPNTVQTRMYKINYLPGRRTGSSDLRVSSTSITQANPSSSSSGTGSTSSTTSSGSTGTTRSLDTSSVHMSSDTDFWRDVQVSLESLVGSDKGRSVTLNQGAGVIVVRATPAEQRQVADYLRAVQVTIERQVMLEAKIVEVKLSSGSQTGVNWTLFGANHRLGTIGVAPGTTLSNNGSISNSDVTINTGSAGSAAAAALGSGFYGLAFQAANFSALISFLQTQGDVQVLSSPRIASLNNQKAVLKVGSDSLYVTNVTTTQTSTGSSTTSSPSLTLQPFFSGIALDVTPQIDDTGMVMLHVHPTVSVVTEAETTIDLGSLGSYNLPLASSTINETDSLVRVRDGQIVAIGGLMQQDSTVDHSGIPGLSDLPGVGGLFGYKSQSNDKHELVILIKPTVISEDGQGWPDVEVKTSRLSASN